MNTTAKYHTNLDDLEWLREIRGKITGSFDHTPKRIGDYLREREKTLGDRIFRAQARLVPAKG
ncbi:MAG TPA: hypothetical protein DIT13_01000 [Verrucomicrobiales bacterium]|nr:hypothetical protein [Verrucomicrobiales bacterium]HRJ07905.1 hypothetical protein [Prosthecobacter sp.]HRK14561.1 hypothetical protein [Prosthecobacter sp.]